MIQSRRDCLKDVKHNGQVHAGLWLDRYLHDQKPPDEKVESGKEPPITVLVGEVAKTAEREEYAKFFARWKAYLVEQGAVWLEAAALGRLVVGLGAESVLENSIALHRTYGVPHIPGSALKGLAAAYARQRLDGALWGVETDAYRTLFGDTTSAGYVTFFDALYVPGSGYKGQALYADVITVHHQDYYQEGKNPPADWDDPNPNSFLSATGKYLLALRSDFPEWVQAAFAILGRALREEGIGAKTSSGYGRMEIEPEPVRVEPGRAEAEELMRRVAALSSQLVAPQIPQLADAWGKVPDGAPKLEAAQAILDRVKAAGREKASQGKPWYERLREYVRVKG